MKKRFIAGVVCPKCSTLDSITAYEDSEKQVLIRECIDCGFSDRLSTAVNQPKELETRVTADVKTSSDDAVQVVKIIEP